MSHQEALLRVENISKQFTERRFLFRKRIVQAIDEEDAKIELKSRLSLAYDYLHITEPMIVLEEQHSDE